MTYRGILTPFNLNGIVTNPIGFMAKSTITSAMNHLQRAAVNGETDPMNSAPSALMTGKLMNIGTGMVRLKHHQDYKPVEEEEAPSPGTALDVDNLLLVQEDQVADHDERLQDLDPQYEEYAD
jgi:hypothetical protein